MKKFILIALLALFALAPTLPDLYAETVEWTPSTTWRNGAAVAPADAAKFTFYLRLWRGTNPSAVPTTAYYFGETRNGGTKWGVPNDNTYIMNQANAWGIVPPLVPGDNVIISVSAAFKADNTAEVDSWTTQKPGNAVAYMIPKPPPPPHPSTSGCNPPSALSIKY